MASRCATLRGGSTPVCTGTTEPPAPRDRRPRGCPFLGPMPGDRDTLTFLAGAKERGGVIVPLKAPKTADSRRKGLVNGEHRREPI